MGLLDKAKDVYKNQEKRHDKAKEKRDEAKGKRDETAKLRGDEIGHVSIGYVGGYDNQKRYSAKLCFYENQIEYSQFGKLVKDLVIKSSDVIGIEVTGQQQTNSRLSVTRMATLGVFSLAAPKRTTIKEASVIISLKDGKQVFFHTKTLSESEVHQKLANAISYYHSLQSSRTGQPQIYSMADEIEKLAKLKENGVITQAEFDKKKAELLN